VNRGDIVIVAGGVYASKPRPAVILQSDRFDSTASITVGPMTTTDIDAPLFRVAIAANAESGISVDSWVMVDKITTVPRTNVAQSAGRASAAQLAEIERCLAVFLGIAE